jgi:translation initiation factor IF-3
VRLAVVFRGREITHPQTGMNVLNRVVEMCNDISTVETTPNMEGRRMIMLITPKPGVVRKAMEAKKAQVAAQMAAEAAKRGPHPGKLAAPQPVVEDDDDLDEDAINADVDDDDDDDDIVKDEKE